MRVKLICIVIFALFYCGCAQIFRKGPEYKIRKREKIVQQALKETKRCISENMSADYQGPVPRRTRVDSITADLEKLNLNIYLSKHFAAQPFRVVNVEEINLLFKRYLGRKFEAYNVTLHSLNHPIAELIPNFYRNDSSTYDSARMPAAVSRDILPLVRRSDKSLHPNKGLYNYNIALWHSHGFYYSRSTDRWEWQRPRLFNTVEDLLPMSFVIPYIVPMLENAGANVFLPRERDLQTEELIIDNDSPDNEDAQGLYIENDQDKWHSGAEPAFAVGTPPYPANMNPFKTGSYRYCMSEPQATAIAEWFADIRETGDYGVYISYHASKENVSDAHYVVKHSGGSTEFLVNQQIGGNTWVYLGQFRFESGADPDSAKVILSNQSSMPGKIVSADAVRFGGGMGNILRGGRVSGYPRFAEAARYYLQYAGMPDTLVYHLNEDTTDYNDDYQSRGEFVNYLKGAPFGPNRDRDVNGLGIPIDLSLSFHTDAGIDTADSTIGTLMIYSIVDAETLTVFPDSMSRMANRDLADIVQTQITDDIQHKYRFDWTRRDLRNAVYSEVWRPNVPSILLELLSHQNYGDMKYALSPNFRFDVSRSIYKGMLRFLSHQFGFDYAVQPLPVSHFRAELSGETEVILSWRPVSDPLEPTAVSTKFIVYMRTGDHGFDNGTVVTTPEYKFSALKKNHIYSFKVTAANDGGESFPSEILSVCRTANSNPTVLIVNGFDRVAPPDYVETKSFKGFANFSDPGVADKYMFNFTGSQFDFDPASPYRTNDAPGHGASSANYETRIIMGNTFDNAYVHGQSIAAAGYSFVSSSDEAVMDSLLSLNDYSIVDLILGEEKTTTFPEINNSSISEDGNTRYKTFPARLRNQITTFCNNGGNIFISGAYVATDLMGKNKIAAQDSLFAADILRMRWETDHAALTGALFSVDTLLLPKFTHFNYNVNYCDSMYAVESPDALAPVNGSKTVLRYLENRFSAGTAYMEDYGIVIFGFPFETIIGQKTKNQLMRQILHAFSNRNQHSLE